VGTLPGPTHPPRPVDVLLDGLALLVTDRPAAAAPVLRQATGAFADADMPVDEVLRWGWLAREADYALWDDSAWGLQHGRFSSPVTPARWTSHPSC
jgi:hypothetical protein